MAEELVKFEDIFKVKKTPNAVIDGKVKKDDGSFVTLDKNTILFQKENNIRGKIYFSYNGTDVIEIGNITEAYACSSFNNLTPSQVYKLDDLSTKTGLNTNTIIKNSIICQLDSDNKVYAIGIITNVDSNKVDIKTIYEPTYLEWTDYLD